MISCRMVEDTGGSEEQDRLADGNDPAADVVEIRLRDDAFSGAFLKRRQHDFICFAGVDREKEILFVPEFHEHSVAVARCIRPAKQKPPLEE